MKPELAKGTSEHCGAMTKACIIHCERSSVIPAKCADVYYLALVPENRMRHQFSGEGGRARDLTPVVDPIC
jgi:hypothetical protein